MDAEDNFSGTIVNTIIKPDCKNGNITLGKFTLPRMDTNN